MERKPDADLYPPYHEDYCNDMKKWREQTGCNYPDCECSKTLMKGTCKHEHGAVMDLKKKHPELQF